MALIKAFTGALGGTFADQWLDIITDGMILAAVQALWKDVARQILDQGLQLGVHADLPRLPAP